MAATDHLFAWLALCRVNGLGPSTICRLARHLGPPDAVVAASDEAMEALGVGHGLATRIRQRPGADVAASIAKEVETIERSGIDVVTILDDRYPKRLGAIADPPPLLFVTGSVDALHADAVAIVGSRKATPAGRAFAKDLSQQLAAVGVTVVSGLARGIDRSAHEGAIAAHGQTVAVLGCGIDQTYPREHRALRATIEKSGAVVSEFPPGLGPHAYHFPQRNRVISGLSLGVVITEATDRSGSLITARLALEQNREVFAVPGAVTSPLSRGPHRLIKQGAKLVEHMVDVVEELLPQLDDAIVQQWNVRQEPPLPSVDLNEHERVVYDRIALDPVSLDDLLAQSAEPQSHVMEQLLSLEMKGLIQTLAGSRYVRTSTQ